MNANQLLDAIGDIDDTLLEGMNDAHIPLILNWKKAVVLTAAVMLMVSGTITALAWTVPDVNDLLYRVWPWAAQALKPVSLSCEDEGIRMEVISASLSGNEALVYISLQDLTGDRIDGTTDLFDSANLLLPYDGSGTCHMVSYDPETKTATFLVSMTFFTDTIRPGNVTFHVGCFLSQKKTETVDLTGLIDWTAAARKTEGVSQPSWLGGGFTCTPIDNSISGDRLSELVHRLKVLPVSGLGVSIADEIILEDYGIVNDALHIRIRSIGNSATDSHCFLSLFDAAGNEISAGPVLMDGDRQIAEINSIGWMDGNDQMNEFFFLADTLEGVSLTAECVTAPPAVNGNWSVTFPLENILADNP